jgi:ribosomal protein S18 acetylase RimI-like enzyme
LILEEFSPEKHDVREIAKLTYNVDEDTYIYLFKTAENAIQANERMLLGGYRNPILYKNHEENSNLNSKKRLKEKTFFRVISDNNENKEVLGILSINKGKRNNFFKTILGLFKIANFKEGLKFFMLMFLNYMVLSTLNEDDYYLAELSISEKHRNQGFGTKIVKNIIGFAKKEGFKRVVLDVDSDNTDAKRLYESIGFKKFNKKTSKIFYKKREMYNMEYVFENQSHNQN